MKKKVKYFDCSLFAGDLKRFNVFFTTVNTKQKQYQLYLNKKGCIFLPPSRVKEKTWEILKQ